MRKLFIITAMAFVMGVAFIACQKEETLLPHNESAMTSTTTSDQEYPLDLYEPTDSSRTAEEMMMSGENGNPKAGGILGATSASQIPSQFFKVATKYKNSYVHLQQNLNASFGECSWTSYVVCTGAIGNATNNPYPVTPQQVSLVKSRCNSSATISKLANYAGNYDYNIVNYRLRSGDDNAAGRFKITKYMLDHINTHHTPFVALALDAQSNKGHYLVVWSIDWKVGGTGSTVYYTNTLRTPASTFDGNLQSTSLTNFLNWMRDNPSADYYNCLFLWNM